MAFRVLGISGSLRRDSYNSLLLRAAADLLPPDAELVPWRDLKAVPPFDADDEALTAPPAVESLRAAVAGADAVLLAAPEYNRSIPGQLKNALDWVSRPVATNPMRHKPAAVIGASTGMFGGMWGQAELRKVLGALGARVLEDDLPVPLADEAFERGGRLRDRELEQRLAALLEALVEVARTRAATLPAGRLRVPPVPAR